MTYQSNIPRATDLISVSQGDLLNNFTSMQSTFTTDHFGFDPIANIGFHKHVTLPDQTSSAPTTIASQMAIYSKTISTITLPYYRRDGILTDFPVSPIKAFVRMICNPASIVGTAFNVTSVSRSGAGAYLINIAANTLPDANYLIIATSIITPGISITGTASSNILANIDTRQSTTGNLTDPVQISVVILELA